MNTPGLYQTYICVTKVSVPNMDVSCVQKLKNLSWSYEHQGCIRHVRLCHKSVGAQHGSICITEMQHRLDSEDHEMLRRVRKYWGVWMHPYQVVEVNVSLIHRSLNLWFYAPLIYSWIDLPGVLGGVRNLLMEFILQGSNVKIYLFVLPYVFLNLNWRRH